MDNETMQLIYEGKDILFTFRHEAREFAWRNGLDNTIMEINGDTLDTILVYFIQEWDNIAYMSEEVRLAKEIVNYLKCDDTFWLTTLPF